MGVVNSGLFIVKNTLWSRNFLQKWLDIKSADSMFSKPPPPNLPNSEPTRNKTKPLEINIMDQLAFDKAYRSLLPGIVEHIMILRSDALNSNFPAWRYQQQYNQVLHLAATSNMLRRRAFKQGLEAVCGHVDFYQVAHMMEGDERGDSAVTTELPQQIGLSRDSLMALRENLPVEETILESCVTLEQFLQISDRFYSRNGEMECFTNSGEAITTYVHTVRFIPFHCEYFKADVYFKHSI